MAGTPDAPAISPIYGTQEPSHGAPSYGAYQNPNAPISGTTRSTPGPSGFGGMARATAVVEGVVEGTAEAIDAHGLAGATHRAIDQADRLAHLGRGGRPQRPSRMAQKLHEATGRATAKVHEAREFMDDTVQDVRNKAGAVMESGRRAVAAPPIVSRDVRKGLGAWLSGVALGAGWMSGMAVAAGFALVLLSMAAVVGLASIAGYAWALFIVGAVYGAAAFVCFGAAKTARKKANKKAELHFDAARADIRYVADPVREAFAPKP